MANSTSPVPQVVEGTGAVAKINELIDALSQGLIGGKNWATSALLVWGYLGGRVEGINVADGTLTLAASTTSYVVMKKSDGVVSFSTATTHWNNSTDYWHLYVVVTNTTTVASYTDERLSAAGLFGGGGGGGGGMSNPMNALGDIIVGGTVTGGVAAPTALAKGTALQVLRVNAAGTALEYATPAGGSSVAIPIACSDESTALVAGVAKVTFRMPYAFTLSAVRASVTTAPTGSDLTVDINESGTSILSTKLTIDATEKTSTTAAIAPVISDPNLADDAEITIDIDGVGSTIAGTGLKVYLIGTP